MNLVKFNPQYDEILADSRIIAEELGVQHKNILRNIREYSDDLQEFGTLAIQSQGSIGKKGYAEYFLLNEQQSNLLIGYSMNTKKKRDKMKLFVKAFKNLRDQLESLKKRDGVGLVFKRLQLNRRKAKKGFFLIASFALSEAVGIIVDAGISEDAIPSSMWPDISIGKRFNKWLKDNYPQVDVESFPTYKHECPGSNYPIKARMYPDEYLLIFKSWFYDQYIPNHMLDYLQGNYKQLVISHTERLKREMGLPYVHGIFGIDNTGIDENFKKLGN